MRALSAKSLKGVIHMAAGDTVQDNKAFLQIILRMAEKSGINTSI